MNLQLSKDSGGGQEPRGVTTQPQGQAATASKAGETVAVPREMEIEPGGVLARYFSEMAEVQILKPSEEIELAKEVRRLEEAYWRALLGNPSTLEAIEAVLKEHLEEMPPQVASLRRVGRANAGRRLRKRDQERWDRLAQELSEKLRELDVDRIIVKDAHAAVRRLAGEGDAGELITAPSRVPASLRRYLGRVHVACEAQRAVKNRFVAANLRLVVSMARRYNRGRLPMADLVQEGNFGLIKAVERFDHTRGYRFSTYASWWIRHALTRGMADRGRLVRVPVHMVDAHYRVTKATRKIIAQTGVEPDDEALQHETGISAEKLSALRESGVYSSPFSLDSPVDDEDGSRRFVDLVEDDATPTPEEKLESKTWNDEVQRLLGKLTPMEARILRWRFGIDGEDELTLREIGDKYNLSRERIRQIEVQALGKIRDQVEERKRLAAERQAMGVPAAS